MTALMVKARSFKGVIISALNEDERAFLGKRIGSMDLYEGS
jgi:hypothetical protein